MADIMNESYIDGFADVPPLTELNLIPNLKTELTHFLSAAKSFKFTTERAEMSEFTKQVLKFWADNSGSKVFPTWVSAARIVFSLSPNSASCERVFSLLAQFYGDTREGALADQIEASLMLNYNERHLG